MSKHPVIALVDDLMITSRIESAASASGRTAVFPLNEHELKSTIQARNGQSALLLVSLTSRLPWANLVPYSRGVAAAEDVMLRVIAFGPHMDLQLRQLALDAGLEEIWANSRLMTDLPGLLAEE